MVPTWILLDCGDHWQPVVRCKLCNKSQDLPIKSTIYEVKSKFQEFAYEHKRCGKNLIRNFAP